MFLTTTLPYANSVPHIGHTLEFIQADSLARFLRNKNDVIFNLGLDEHGSKIYEKSQELGITPQELVDSLAIKWKEFCHKFEISCDNFYRTSDKSHYDAVHKFWNICLEKGDIYKKSYTGKYCSGCESFIKEADLIDNHCQDHPTTEIKEISEENYFFKLSNYKNILIKYLESDFLKPTVKNPELLNIINEFDEISISRLRSVLPWGIPVPNDSTQTIYVWYDALANYIIAAGWGSDDKKFKDYWTEGEVVQICGPDNLRFQGHIWQSLLSSVGIKLTNKLLVHGTVLDSNGKKISKSVGNVIDPIEILDKFGLDPIRFYILSGLNTYSNCNWDDKELIFTWNSLANSWGNLVSRTLHLVDKFGISEGTNELESVISSLINESDNLWKNYEIKLAIQKTNEAVSEVNRWITDNEPWKTQSKIDIGILYKLLSLINKSYEPVIPNSCKLVEEAINLKKKAIIFNKII